ncbi:MAG: cell division protein ZapD [Thiofilum sp.]|uniref:cell division protein ZapD n=1 Tax=Thiofilum sp. TaxID=2212733 RepID=UPI0025EA6BBC|nr:cell division protein ZapD [Thiofilum sp.]MBK8452028.1 cell division protein ZapD [Thiofilum sp.]
MIIYEQPLTEKIRLFLRLEALVKRYRYHMRDPDAAPEESLAALLVLLDLYNLAARVDLKSEVIKELDRIALVAKQTYSSEAGTETLAVILDQLQQHAAFLHALPSQLGNYLRDHSFFSNLRQRAALPGGLNGFDSPVLHFWYQRPIETRRANLESWSKPYQVAADALTFSLNLIRNCCDTTEVVAKAGFFQMVLDSRKPYQLLQIMLPNEERYYPEISAGKQRFSLRFLDSEEIGERSKQQSTHDIIFYLKLCNF